MRKDTVTIEVRRGMYGLPQAGILTNQQLRTLLSKHGYDQYPTTHGLFRHKSRDISFTIVVNNYDIKYTNAADLDHLMRAVCEMYIAAVDTSGTLYRGLTLKWYYRARHVDISTPKYVNHTLQTYAD